MILQKLLQGLTVQKQTDRRAQIRHSLLRQEAKIGGTLFGPVPAGGKREFFRLDEYTWVWYEEWRGEMGQRHSKTTRYEMRGDKILKSVNGRYQPITQSEAERLREAIRQYVQKVDQELYARIMGY